MCQVLDDEDEKDDIIFILIKLSFYLGRQQTST